MTDTPEPKQKRKRRRRRTPKDTQTRKPSSSSSLSSSSLSSSPSPSSSKKAPAVKSSTSKQPARLIKDQSSPVSSPIQDAEIFSTPDLTPDPTQGIYEGSSIEQTCDIPYTPQETKDIENKSSKTKLVVGIKFTSSGKIHEYINDKNLDCQVNDEVVVETKDGQQIGIVAIQTINNPHQNSSRNLLRKPTELDKQTQHSNSHEAQEALRIARQYSHEKKLSVKFFRATYSLGRKLRIYFSTEDSLDFYEFTQHLQNEIQGVEVEMKKTGARDTAKIVGGIGSCGRELCCTTYLPSFVPISIKTAKDQNLALTPSKISGQCGRLKCCLVYEHASYKEKRREKAKEKLAASNSRAS